MGTNDKHDHLETHLEVVCKKPQDTMLLQLYVDSHMLCGTIKGCHGAILLSVVFIGKCGHGAFVCIWEASGLQISLTTQSADCIRL